MPIRNLKKQDIDSLIHLLQELNTSLHENQVIHLNSILGHFSEMEKNKDIYLNLVYEENGSIIGFMSMIYYRSMYHRKGTALINELIVTNEYRNTGIGSKLLEYGIQRAKENGMDEIEVGVMKNNAKAIKFYKNHGINEEYLLLGMEFD